MRGYVSFLLVMAGSLILIDLLAVYSASTSIDLSTAIAAERAYGLEMNVKEIVLESVRSGGSSGFSGYDRTHELRKCMHCMDHSCALPTPANPLPPNRCDPVLCGDCFRESGAREAAVEGAMEMLSGLGTQDFDPDFSIEFAEAELETALGPDPLARNGFFLDSLRFRKIYRINLSSAKFGMHSESGIPGGFTVDIG